MFNYRNTKRRVISTGNNASGCLHLRLKTVSNSLVIMLSPEKLNTARSNNRPAETSQAVRSHIGSKNIFPADRRGLHRYVLFVTIGQRRVKIEKNRCSATVKRYGKVTTARNWHAARIARTKNWKSGKRRKDRTRDVSRALRSY